MENARHQRNQGVAGAADRRVEAVLKRFGSPRAFGHLDFDTALQEQQAGHRFPSRMKPCCSCGYGAVVRRHQPQSRTCGYFVCPLHTTSDMWWWYTGSLFRTILAWHIIMTGQVLWYHVQCTAEDSLSWMYFATVLANLGLAIMFDWIGNLEAKWDCPCLDRLLLAIVSTAIHITIVYIILLCVPL